MSGKRFNCCSLDLYDELDTCRTEMLIALSRRLRVLYMMTGQPLANDNVKAQTFIKKWTYGVYT